MSFNTKTALAICSLAVALFGSPAASGAAEPWVITTSTTLTADHQGSIELGADGITLNCAGHSLTGPGSSGVLLQNVTSATVKNCRIVGFEVGFYLVSAPRNRLENNVVSDSAHDGFVIASSPDNDNNVLIGNTSAGNGGWGFAVYDNSADTTLKGNVATANAFAGFFTGLGSDRTRIVENRADGNIQSGFDIDSDENVVSGNTAENNLGLGYFIFQASRNAFTSNTAQDNVGGFLVVGSDLHDSLHNVFTGNTARKNTQTGFGFAHGSSDSRLIGNSAADNGLFGFQLDSISDNVLVGNEALRSGSHGFVLTNVFATTATDNRSRENGGLGFVAAESHGNTLEQNAAMDNALAGFRSIGSWGNSFTANLSIRNLNGFALIASHDETLTRNLALRNRFDGTFLLDTTDSQLTENLGNANEGIGFDVFSGSTGNALGRNSGHGNGILDARDENPAGANQWADNSFGTSSLP